MKLKLHAALALCIIAIICTSLWFIRSGVNDEENRQSFEFEPVFDDNSFFKAVYRGDNDYISFFLKAGVSPSVKENGLWRENRNGLGWTGLHIAAFKGNIPLIRMFLNKGVPVDSRDDNAMTALHWAAFSGSREWADCSITGAFRYYEHEELKDYCVPINMAWTEYHQVRSNELPAVENAAYSDVSALLLERGSDVNARDSFGQTPLHIAAYVGNVKLVDFLLKKGADADLADRNGRSPLHLAARGDHRKVVQLLMVNGAQVNRKDIKGLTPLHLAVTRKENSGDTVKELISQGAAVNAIDSDGWTPLFYSRSIDTARLLIDAGNDVKIRDKEGRTFLHRLVCGNMNLTDLATEDRDQIYELKGILPSTGSMEEELMDLILERGISIDDRDVHGASALHYALSYGRDRSAIALIKRKGNVNAGDNMKKTPLHYMAEKSSKIYLYDYGSGNASQIREIIVNTLLKAGADINAKDIDGAAPVDYAIWRGGRDVIALFEEKGGKRSMALPAAAQDAAGSGDTGELRKMLDQNPKLIHSRGLCSTTLLHIAAEGGHLECCSLIAERGGEVNAKDNLQETPLIRAVGKGHYSVVKLLVNKGADIHCKNRFGDTIFSNIDRKHEILRYLIEKGEDSDLRANNHSYGTTLLHQIAGCGDVETARLIVKKGIDVNIRDMTGRTPLHHCTSRVGNEGSNEMLSFLISQGALVNAQDGEGKTTLHYACMSGFYETAKLLISKGADVNMRDEDGLAPLHMVESPRIADLLIGNGADVNGRTRDGRTPLHCAGNDECITLFVASGADINARSGCGETPLFNVVKEGHDKGALLLLSKGADVNTKNVFGSTPLLEAVKNNDSDSVKLLVSHGADVNARDGLGRTPLMLAGKLENGRKMCEYLKAHGAIISRLSS
ncbi:MAG: ankyrin repeat domain-containing protein [Candidatus Xenobiia bacterium LiM19]